MTFVPALVRFAAAVRARRSSSGPDAQSYGIVAFCALRKTGIVGEQLLLFLNTLPYFCLFTYVDVEIFFGVSFR